MRPTKLLRLQRLHAVATASLKCILSLDEHRHSRTACNLLWRHGRRRRRHRRYGPRERYERPRRPVVASFLSTGVLLRSSTMSQVHRQCSASADTAAGRRLCAHITSVGLTRHSRISWQVVTHSQSYFLHCLFNFIVRHLKLFSHHVAQKTNQIIAPTGNFIGS